MKSFVLFCCTILFAVMNSNGSSYSDSGKPHSTVETNGTFDEFSQFEMPIVKITTDSGAAISSKEEYIKATTSVINKQGNYEMTDTKSKIRLRGNITMYAPKKSYKVKFEEKQNILNIGTGSSKPWCLLANFFDGSLMRNLMTYRIADLLDGMLYSPNGLSVELFINDEYQGVYLLCEKVNVNKARVAIDENPEKVEDNGYLIEMSRYDEKNSFSVDKQEFTVKSDLSETESVKKTQMEYITGYMAKCISLLKRGNKTEVEQYIDLQSLIDIYILNEIVKNVDVGWSSFFMFKNANEKLHFGPPWDFDLAIGNANCVKGFDSWAGISPYHVLNVNANSNPWFCYALENKWFREAVQERWASLNDKITTLPEVVTMEAETHYKSYCRNFEKWNTILGNQVYIEPKQIASLTSFKEHYTYLRDWLDKRIKWLTNYYSTNDFVEGIFIDDSSKVLSLATNRVEVSSILALANSPDVKMTYTMLPDQGVTIAIENAGKELWATQIAVTGFMLEKGEEYELSCEYKSSGDHSVKFDIQQNHTPWKSFYSDTINCSKEFQNYKTTFTVSESDNNCALAFSLGGAAFNSSEITINKMNLVLKKAANVGRSDFRKSTSPLKNVFYDSNRKLVCVRLSSASTVDINLYSLAGRKVFSISEEMNAGKHFYQLKNIGLVSGTYIGQVKTGSHIKRWIMVLTEN